MTTNAIPKGKSRFPYRNFFLMLQILFIVLILIQGSVSDFPFEKQITHFLYDLIIFLYLFEIAIRFYIRSRKNHFSIFELGVLIVFVVVWVVSFFWAKFVCKTLLLVVLLLRNSVYLYKVRKQPNSRTSKQSAETTSTI